MFAYGPVAAAAEGMALMRPPRACADDPFTAKTNGTAARFNRCRFALFQPLAKGSRL